jgi:GNAT superfamily N-acetyltransferase
MAGKHGERAALEAARGESMRRANGPGGGLEIRPLTVATWPDFEQLFGPRGAYGGCWCMWWRLTRREFEAQHGEGNRRAMKALVESGVVPGILGYLDGAPAAWCSVAPREQFQALERSRVMARIDDTPVWSIVCFYFAREARRRGLMRPMIRAAVEQAARHGGRVVEAYPTLPRGRELPPVSSFMGLPAAFAAEGFVEVARPSARRVVMRHVHAGRGTR